MANNNDFEINSNDDDFDFFAQLEKINKQPSIEEDTINVFDEHTSVKDISLEFIDTNHIIENSDFVKIIFDEKISIIEDDIDEELYNISKSEAEDMVEAIEYILENIEEKSLNLEKNIELKRYLHTFKGSVKMAGANKIGALAHRLESLLDFSEGRKISLYNLKDILNEEFNKIKYLLLNIYEPLTEDKLNWLDGTKIEKISENSITPLIDTVKETKNILAKSIKKEEKQHIKILSNLVDQLINEAGEIRLTRTTLEGVLNGNKKSIVDLKESSFKLDKMLKEIESQSESQIQAGKDKLHEDGIFDPLEFDRFTRVQELTRLMNEAVSDIQDTILDMEFYLKTQNTAISQQSILTNNILDSLMNIRLVSIATIEERLYAITRKTSKELLKKINLKLIGEDTEIDRLVLDKIISPLEHLLRNCIAHGIESPEERIIKGKQPVGKIILKTSVNGNFILMEIQDDGAGINLEKVKNIALKKGLITNNKDYSSKEIIELIFQPGFSTADSVSQVSGRGVGMEIVKNDITALGGSISIETVEGQGTIFSIILPVAVATTQAMLTENMGKLVAIPALLVNEVISLKKDKMLEAYNNGYITHKNKKIPLAYMGHLMGLLQFTNNPEVKTYNTLLLVSYLNENIVIHVDKLQTTSEILIKGVGNFLNKVSGVLGATILGDGRQGIVINPILLNQHYEKYIKIKSIELSEDKTLIKKDIITVMVVDDSLTVRRASSKILERNNYNVILGKDGVDALEQLKFTIPDIILSDIEMPNMDGFEFVKNIKSNNKYNHIPIIMISSRTADKHRNHAFELGVNDFLGKPYQEDELLEKIKKLTFHN